MKGPERRCDVYIYRQHCILERGKEGWACFGRVDGRGNLLFLLAEVKSGWLRSDASSLQIDGLTCAIMQRSSSTIRQGPIPVPMAMFRRHTHAHHSGMFVIQYDFRHES